MTFRVGDIAIVRHLPDIPEWMRGYECTVMTGLVHVQGVTGARHRIEFDLPSRGRSYYAAPHALKPLPDPRTPSTWEAGVWRPIVVGEQTT